MKVSKCPKCSHHSKIGYKHSCELNPQKTILGQISDEMFIEHCHFFTQANGNGNAIKAIPTEK